jgi:putative transposase
MPWQGQTPVQLRRRFIEDYLADIWTVTELCAMYQISRQTGYEVITRFETEGWSGLKARSRRPHRTPQAVTPAVVRAVCAARATHPDWGARKVRRWLITQHPARDWPSRMSIHRIWQRAGVVAALRPRRRASLRVLRRLRVATQPNDVWTVDFKGDFRLGSGDRCYPLTVRDLASRFTLRCDALPWPDGTRTKQRFERAFQEFGLPACIRSDNGEPFAGPGLAGLSRLNIWWLRLGIAVEQIAPGRPDQNGSHEQFHRILKARTTQPPAHTLTAQQRRFQRFCREYNEERPHQALQDAVPAECYRPSPRPWPRQLPPLEYPGHWDPRRVQLNGRITLGAQSIFLSRALAGEWVALEEHADDLWTIHFGTLPLARWVPHRGHLRPLQAVPKC